MAEGIYIQSLSMSTAIQKRENERTPMTVGTVAGTQEMVSQSTPVNLAITPPTIPEPTWTPGSPDQVHVNIGLDTLPEQPVPENPARSIPLPEPFVTISESTKTWDGALQSGEITVT